MTTVPATTITIPVDGGSAVAVEAGQSGSPVLTVITTQPLLLSR
jgi:hypothetical protein